MPKEGIFAKVIESGKVAVEDMVEIATAPDPRVFKGLKA